MSLEPRSLEALFELSRDAVIGTENKNRTVVFVNPAARELLGAQVGAPASRFIPREIIDEPSERFVAAAQIGGESVDISVTRQEGLSLYILPRSSVSDTLDSLPEAAAAEMGSLLMTERLALDRLTDLSRAEADDKLSPYVSVLYRNYYRVKRLHDHIVTAVSLRKNAVSFHPRLVSPEEIFRDACDTVRSLLTGNDVSLVFEAPEEPCLISGDPRLLETLLFNLLSNSLLHTHGGHTVRVSLTVQGHRCVLAVDDAGTGIPPERLSTLLTEGWEPDLTDPGAGTGLGLIIARGIAELHGGTLLIESRRDVGTRLRVSFPLAEDNEIMHLRGPEISYRSDGMDLALTELSVVLDKSVYTHRMFD